MRRIIIVVVALAIICAGPVVAQEVYNQIQPGQTARITTADDQMPCFDTLANLQAGEHAADVNDTEGMAQLGMGGHIIQLRAGWRVRAIDYHTNWGAIDAVEFRLLTGDDAGRACYVNANTDGLLKDVR